jgi:hypothetical protein
MSYRNKKERNGGVAGVSPAEGVAGASRSDRRRGGDFPHQNFQEKNRSLIYLLCIALSFSACSRCQKNPVVAPTTTAKLSKQSTDIQQPLMALAPEVRGAKIDSTRLTLTRTLVSDLSASEFQSEARKLNLIEIDGGFAREPFLLSQLNAKTLQLSMEISEDTLGKIMTSPLPITTEEMGLNFPRHLPVGRELFVFEIQYSTRVQSRAALLTEFASTHMASSNQWKITSALPAHWNEKVDAGTTLLPDDFSVQLEHVQLRAKVHLHRRENKINGRYELVTIESIP